MNRPFTATAVALLLAAAAVPAHAESTRGATVPAAELEALRAELARLAARVQELEAQTQAAGAQAQAAVEKQAETEARLADVEATNDGQTDVLAKTRASLASADWAGKVKWKGDFRYRNETFDVENVADRWRDRIRVRAGLEAKVSDGIAFGMQIATGDDADPRSRNATLSDANRRKTILLDMAYVDWKAFDGGVVTIGKQKQPWFRPGNNILFDNDVNPEGGALRYAAPNGVFANAWAFWLRESGAAADANMVGGQVGWAAPMGFTVAVGYTDYGSIEGESILSFSDSPAGNSTFNGTSSCGLPAPTTGPTRCYLYDYRIVDVGLQWDGKVGSLPLSLYANFMQNQDPDDLDTAYVGGFMLGKASNAHTWEVGALYAKVERDAQFGALVDSNFAGGLTQGKGWLFRAGYAPAKNVVVNAQYFLNQRNYDTASEVDYRRLQIDASFKF